MSLPFCEFCFTEFDSKSNINKHQKTSIYCIKIQKEKDPSKTIEIIVHECDFCKRQLSTKYALQKHLTTCKIKLKSVKKEESELIKVKKEMTKLQEEVAQLKEKPSITVNNTDNSVKTITANTHNYSSLLDFSTESVTETFKKHYNKIEHLLQGDQKHLADVTVKHLLSGKDQPMYYVTDRSRNKFMYTDSDKNEKEDANASILRSLVYRGVKPIVKGLYQDEFKRLRKELAMYQRKDDDDEDADACVMSRHRDLKELEEAYHQMDIIKESDDYVVQLSKCLPSSIRDRIYKDNLDMIDSVEYDSDDEFKRQLEHESRMIGDYSVLELQKYKDLYNQTGETRGPPSIIENPKYRKEFVSFLNEVI